MQAQEYNNQSPMLPIALIIPGNDPITTFNQMESFYYTVVENPCAISNICCVLTGDIPNHLAIVVSFSLPSQYQNLNYKTQNMQYIGALANNHRSDIFAPGFPLNPDVSSCNQIAICFEVKNFQECSQLAMAASEDNKKAYSKLVAQNLYNFMLSFHRDGLLQEIDQGKYLVVPSDFLHRWLQKFEEKYLKDPNFIMKTTSN